MSAFIVLPAAARLDASAQVLFRQLLIRRLAKFIPPLMLLPIAAAVVALIVCRTSVKWSLESLGLILSVATIGITVAINGPLSGHIGRWSPDALPQNWKRDVRRWDVAHSIRTVTALGAFVCSILATS